MPRTVVHVLTVHDIADGRCNVTATIRQGKVSAGDALWFAAADGSHREVEVVSRQDGRRHMTLELAGAAEALRHGVYLYAT